MKSDENKKQVALDIFYSALNAVKPEEVVRKALRREDSFLIANGESIDLDSIERVFVVGAGKASAPMAKAVEDILGDRINDGLVIVKDGYTVKTDKIVLKEAAHPIPDERGLEATSRLLQLVEMAGERDLVLCLISGGGSSLLELPPEGITLEDLQRVTEELLYCGANIEEINTLRRHLSQVKGGRLAQKAYPARIVSFILSDVLGNPLESIASGPTAPDPTSFEDALCIIQRYKLYHKLPENVMMYLQKGVRGEIPDTPGYSHDVFAHVSNIIIGSNHLAAQSALHRAKAFAFNTLLLSSFIEGEAREIARVLVAIAREVKNSGNPLPAPACIIAGGEVTVRVVGNGKGGRCSELALAASIALNGMEDVVILAAATDGTDGPTDAAGAFVTGSTYNRGVKKGLFAEEFLSRNDSYHYFKILDDLLITGPTNTNVNDLYIILCF